MLRSLLIAFVCTMTLAFTVPAMAQDKPGLKIGVAAVNRVFAEAAEAKDITNSTNQMEAEFKQKAIQKEKELKELERKRVVGFTAGAEEPADRKDR